MRLLLVSDLHYTLRQFDFVVDVAPDFDVVVMAGDHLDISSAVELDAQIVVVGRYLEVLRDATSLIVSSGNHDLTGDDPQGERAALWMSDTRAAGIPTDGDTIELGDTMITICPWWDGPIGREAVEAQLVRDVARRPARWIWVYHWPPTGSPTSWTGTKHYGDPDLAGWIDRFAPDIVLTGHVHEPPFKPGGSWWDRTPGSAPSWIFNPGRQIGPMPTRIELDLDAGTATWRSLMGDEMIELAPGG